MSERFYVERRSTSESVSIDGSEARHISRVMRLGPGDQVILFDGEGSECLATISSLGKNSVSLQPEAWKVVSREPSIRVVAAVALPKGDRLKFMIEKLTELGVARVVPLTCQRSSVRPRENTIAKMRRYVIEASKQCGRNLLMEISEPVNVQQLIQLPPDSCSRYCCLPDGKWMASGNFIPVSNEAWFMVGPEGGFTDDEIALAKETDWRALRLGASILRTETAIIASCVIAINSRR